MPSSVLPFGLIWHMKKSCCRSQKSQRSISFWILKKMNGISRSLFEVKTYATNIADKTLCQAEKWNRQTPLTSIPPPVKRLRKSALAQRISASFGKDLPCTYPQATSTSMPSFPIPEEDRNSICSPRKHPAILSSP